MRIFNGFTEERESNIKQQRSGMLRAFLTFVLSSFWVLQSLFVAPLLASCGSDVDPSGVALQTAKLYYEQLLQGDYDAFVDGSLKGDSVSAKYRRLQVLNSQMFAERLQRDHKGVAFVEAISANADTASHTADAFLALHFNDSVTEQIVVPMVEKNGIWYMR